MRNAALRVRPVVRHNGAMPNPETDAVATAQVKDPPLPSSRSSDARALRSGQALREALLALLRRKPFDQITVRDICAESGVHYATFFRHYPAKEQLLDDIAKDQIRHLVALSLSIRHHESYQSGFRALCSYVEEHRSLWATLLNGGAGATMREEWVRQSQAVAANEPAMDSWLPQQLGTICAATLIAETLAWWVAQPDTIYGVDQIAQILNRLLIGSIIAPD